MTSANEYARVDFYTKWADFDAGPEPKMKEQAAQMQALTTRIFECVESHRRIIDEVLPEYSLPPPPKFRK